jgi:phthalate 4,5-dioxygenase oxygenase subunit
MLTCEDNELLTRVSAGTPMGELMRRFWIPAVLETEVAEPDGSPVRVRLLGEDLIAFRSTDGAVGLFDSNCPHRRAPLFFARNEECGLRCVYHGWKFDVSGQCVDMPTEPDNAIFMKKVRIKSYPTRVRGGVVWAYMGPPDHMPELPEFEWACLPERQRYVVKRRQQSNWAQAIEGGLDSAHISFLHRHTESQLKAGQSANGGAAPFMRGTDAVVTDRGPMYEVENRPYGLQMGARRNSGPDHYYWRISHFLMPFYSLFPPGGSPEYAAKAPYNGHAFVPIDDENTWTWSFGASPHREYSAEERSLMSGHDGFWGPIDGNFMPLLNRHNDYLIDRKQQKFGDFTGIRGVANQDAAVQEGMGAICDRTKEHLGASDRGIVMFRRTIMRAARELADGTEPKAAQSGRAYGVRSVSVILPRSAPLETVSTQSAHSGELAG